MYKCREDELLAYEYSAKKFKEYTKSINFDSQKKSIIVKYSKFQNDFGWRNLVNVTDDEALELLFGNSTKSLTSFCMSDKLFGSTGGMRVKSTLPVYNSKNKWHDASNKEIDIVDALKIANDYRKQFILLQKKIEDSLYVMSNGTIILGIFSWSNSVSERSLDTQQHLISSQEKCSSFFLIIHSLQCLYFADE